MVKNRNALILSCVFMVLSAGCSRQQSEWQKARETNTTEAYEQFAAQAQARVKDLYEEHDWQKARDADTPEAYQAFLKDHPEGKFTEEARIRVENFTLAQAPGASTAPGGPAPPGTATAPGAATVPGTPSAPATASAPGTASAPITANHTGHAAAPPATGPYGVQLGAFKSGADAANRRWTHLQKEYPKLLAGLSSKVVPKQTASGTVYRLQAFGATEKHARNICKSLKAKSQACMVVQPTQA
jgi:cell division protein FtsN